MKKSANKKFIVIYDLYTLNTKPPHKHFAKSPFTATDFHFKKGTENKVNSSSKNTL